MALSTYGREQALIALMPGGTNRYVALFTTKPDDDGTGGVECTGSGYARKVYSSWVSITTDGVTYRKNNGAIEFVALSDALSGVVAYGIYDASSGGNLIDFDDLLDSGGEAVTKNFIAGDQPRFLDQELKVGLGEEA